MALKSHLLVTKKKGDEVIIVNDYLLMQVLCTYRTCVNIYYSHSLEHKTGSMQKIVHLGDYWCIWIELSEGFMMLRKNR